MLQAKSETTVGERASKVRRAVRTVLDHKICWRDIVVVSVGSLLIAGLGFGVKAVYEEISSLFPSEAALPNLPPGFFGGRYPTANTAEPTYYALYVPPHFQVQPGPFPLIVFLHGYGELEKDLLLVAGVPQMIKEKAEQGERFDFIGFFPQDLHGLWHKGTPGYPAALEMLDYVIERHHIDRKRIYLTGHSSGGCGVWNMASDFPERWAAIAPLCAVCSPDMEKIKGIPCWLFQGDADSRALVANGRRVVAELREAKSEVRITEFPGMKHVIWRETYGNRELYDWFLTRTR